MFEKKFSYLIAKYPQDADALRRVGRYLVDAEIKLGERVFQIKLEPQRLFDIAQAGSYSRLARIVSILIKARIFERHVIVRSPAGGAIEFRSYEELPEMVIDPILDVQMQVTSENTKPIYHIVRL